MGSPRHAKKVTLRTILRAGVAACALGAVLTGSSLAQTAGVPSGLNDSVPPGSKLLLSADELVYNDNTHVVVAQGKVRIDYGGYKMVAKRVEYDQDTGRMKAFGDVELINPDGTKVYADTMDVTDDFADGFVNALRIDTTDRTHIVAESAVRRGGVETQFNNGVYTACEPCKKHPEKAPFWQVKARRVIHDADKKTIRLRDAQFEMFGVPVAYFPYFQMPDQTVKRKSGILRPGFDYTDTLGLGISIPYYQVISPYMDATLTVTGYTKQGFLAEGEFRQRFRNGFHTLTVAGIDQADPEAFEPNTIDAGVSARGLIGSKAEFQINPRWKVGWDLMAQSDGNFARTYDINGYSESTHISEAYLTGLSGRNYFDLHGYYFDVQGADDSSEFLFDRLEDQQPFVLPVIDYSRIEDVAGGQLTFTANETSLTRDLFALENNTGANLANRLTRYRGLEGDDSRITGEVEWKRTFTTSSGLLLTPIFAARGDAFFVNMDSPGSYNSGGFNDTGSNFDYTGDFAGNGTHTRGMVTAGLEARYPILATTAHSSHVIEPIAQIFVRPDEPLAGGLPNEDAQSFVFDTTNLFERDKFSGFDRVEGGTRANIGIQYTGSFDNGLTLQSVFGQSYQIAGENSFASPDLVYAGHDSGLDTDVSDYVGSFGIALPRGFSFNAGARFDKASFEVQRTDLGANYANSRFTTNVVYSQIAPQPDYGSVATQEEVTTSAGLKFAENWRVFGRVTYDLDANAVSRDGLGLAFNNECFALNLVFSEDRNRDNPNDSSNDWSIGATLSFRTLGDVKLGSADFARNQ